MSEDEDGGGLRQQGGVNAVEVAGRLVRVIAEGQGPARLADLARSTAMPTAKVHRYLVSLCRAGLVEQDAATSRYDLGPLALRAGIEALTRSDSLKRAERVLDTIVAATGESAAVAVWGSHGPTLVRLVDARHDLASHVPLGHLCPLTYSATGLIYCAFGDPALTTKLASQELAQSRMAGRNAVPLDEASLAKMLERVRLQGVATVEIPNSDALAAVAAPVFSGGHPRRLRMVLTVFGHVGRLNVSPDGPVAALIRQAARELEQSLLGDAG